MRQLACQLPQSPGRDACGAHAGGHSTPRQRPAPCPPARRRADTHWWAVPPMWVHVQACWCGESTPHPQQRQPSSQTMCCSRLMGWPSPVMARCPSARASASRSGAGRGALVTAANGTGEALAADAQGMEGTLPDVMQGIDGQARGVPVAGVFEKAMPASRSLQALACCLPVWLNPSARTCDRHAYHSATARVSVCFPAFGLPPHGLALPAALQLPDQPEVCGRHGIAGGAARRQEAEA